MGGKICQTLQEVPCDTEYDYVVFVMLQCLQQVRSFTNSDFSCHTVKRIFVCVLKSFFQLEVQKTGGKGRFVSFINLALHVLWIL